MSLQGKKIACFVALPHHTRFLFPILEAMEKKGAQSLFFTTLSDFPFERDLIKKGRECRLLQSYATPDTGERRKKMLDEFLKVWTDRNFTWDGYRHWPFILQASLLNCAIEEFICLDRMIAVERPDVIMALHERNRWGKLLGYYARKYHIPYVTLQEGDYYEDRLSFSGHTEYTTALLLWGQNTFERLQRLLSAPEKMLPIGNTHLNHVLKNQFNDNELAETRKFFNIPPDKKVILFLVGLQWGMVTDAKPWVDLLHELNQRDDVVVIMKWHPKIAQVGYSAMEKNIFAVDLPNIRIVQAYDPYCMLAIADYTVTLGNTTLAVEALSFNKPVFSLPGFDKIPDQYVSKGVAISVFPPGNWRPLYEVMQHGVPEIIQKNIDRFMSDYFHARNHTAIEFATEVIDSICEAKAIPKNEFHYHNAVHPGRVSVVIPSGSDVESLFTTLSTLAEKIEHQDWEAIIVVSDPAILPALQTITGDLIIVEHSSDSLAELYQTGAQYAHGEILVFIKPGLAYLNGAEVYTAALKSVVGLPINNTVGEPISHGYFYDFNGVPRPRLNDFDPLEAFGGGFIGMHRDIFYGLKGFDTRIGNTFVEADLCMQARVSGIDLTLAQGCLYELFPSFNTESRDSWRGRMAFFAKWAGRLPKSEDYLRFADTLLKQQVA